MDIDKLFPDMNDEKARKAFLDRVKREADGPARPEEKPEEGAVRMGILFPRFADASDEEDGDEVPFEGGETVGFGEILPDEEEFDGGWDDTAALLGLTQAIRILSRHLSKKQFQKAMRSIQKAMRG